MNLNNIKNWYAETDKYEMAFNEIINDFDSKYYEFNVITKKFYQGGRRWQFFYLTEILMTDLSEEAIIRVLSDWMEETIVALIANGVIKERGA